MAETEVPKVSTEDAEPTAENHEPASGNVNREVLAPTEGPREELINTAVKFLQNPKVMGSPLHQKKAFLSKKGLTQEEITLAVDRSGVKEMIAPGGSGGMEVTPARPPPPGYQPGAMAPVPSPYGPVYPLAPPPQSRWARVRDLTVTTVVVAGVSYAMYQLYKTYIEPLIRGKSVQEKRIDRLELQIADIHKSVNESLTEISRTLAAIQLSINNQNQQPLASQMVGRSITELKSDISSLRSLMLSKNQFPAPPSTSPMLPSWQLAGASSGGSQTSSSPSNSTSNLSVTTTTTTSQSTPPNDAISASAADTTGEEVEEVAEKSVSTDSSSSVPSQSDESSSQVSQTSGDDKKEETLSS